MTRTNRKLASPDVVQWEKAVQSGQCHALKQAFASGMPVDFEVEGCTALEYAVWGRKVDTLLWLISQGADVHRTYRDQEPLLGQQEHSPTLLHMVSEWENPLPRATTVIDRVLEKGMPIDVQDGRGRTPLHEAIFQDCPFIVRHLVARGANVNITDEEGCSPLHVLSESSIRERRDVKALVHRLLKAGANVNAIDSHGRTPLLIATHCRKGKWDVMPLLKVLLENGADPNRSNEEGTTPLHELALGGKKGMPMMELLLNHGADPRIKDKAGVLPHELAWYDKTKEMLEATVHVMNEREALNAVDRATKERMGETVRQRL